MFYSIVKPKHKIGITLKPLGYGGINFYQFCFSICMGGTGNTQVYTRTVLRNR